MSASNNETVVIKKYANRRLYNTATSSYVTLENLAQMVKDNIEFNVYDAKSNEDITRSVLTQIIVEEEGKSGQTGQNLLPISFLRRLIGFYGDSMQWMVPKYLDQSMLSLTKNQEQIRDYFQNTFGNMFPFGSTIEQMSKQNMAMFEQTMRMFSPFGQQGDASMMTGDTTSSPSSTPLTTSSTTETKVESTSADTAAASVGRVTRKVTPIPTLETSKAVSQNNVSGDDVQNKIAALQRQLSDLARNKA